MRPRVLFISGREASYIRNRVLLNALRVNFDVINLTPQLPTIPIRGLAGLLRFVSRRDDYDLVFVGFYGQPLAVALSVLQQEPVVLDGYVSTYETLCEDRYTCSPNSLLGRVSSWLDWYGFKSANHVLTDTQSDARYLQAHFDLQADKVTTVYVGCDERLFYPRPESKGPFEVFYYGAFLPLHGTEVIIEAARLLKHESEIHFVIGGEGMRFRTVTKLARDLEQVQFVGWIPMHELPDYIARSSICLGGHFSTTPKASRVVSTKTFQFLAMRKATIVGDNPATREILVPNEEVFAVPMGDAEALAEAILVLSREEQLRRGLAHRGFHVFRERLSTDVIAGTLSSVVESALADASGRSG